MWQHTDTHTKTKPNQTRNNNNNKKPGQKGGNPPERMRGLTVRTQRGAIPSLPLHTKHVTVFRGCLRKFAHASLFFSLSSGKLTILEKDNTQHAQLDTCRYTVGKKTIFTHCLQVAGGAQLRVRLR